MGIVLSAFITATCLSSLLWFVLPLMSLLRLIQLSSMELMDTHTAMVPMAMLPHTPMPPQLLLVDMLLLADMLPTLPELSMSPRDPLMLRLMPMMDTHMDTEPTDMDTHTDMELTTERDLLMLSQRLMLMLLSCTEPTDMVLTHMLEPTVPTHMPMVLTHMPMELTTERDLLMLSQRLMLMPLFCMELTDTVPTHIPMELTHTPTDTDTDTHMPTESTESKLFLSRKY